MADRMACIQIKPKNLNPNKENRIRNNLKLPIEKNEEITCL